MKRSFLIIAAFFLVLFPLFLNTGHALDRETLRMLNDNLKIDSIDIEGNHFFTDSKVKEHLYSRVRTFWLGIKGDRRSRLQKETPQRDTVEVKYLYFINGFLDVKVREEFERLSNDKALVKIIIDEGRQYFFGEKRFEGSYPSGFIYWFRGRVKQLKEGEVMNPFEIQKAIIDMKEFMANQGYPYAKISYSLDRSVNTLNTPLIFDVKSDSLVHFGDVTIRGMSRFPEKVARRELTFRPGDIYTREDIIKSQQRLYESGYFSTIQLNQDEESGDRLHPDFTLRVRERKAYYLSFKTGFGQSEDRDLVFNLSGGFGKRNLLGSRRLDFLADYSFEPSSDVPLLTHLYQVRFTEPWFLGIRMPLRLTFQWEPPIREVDKRYKIETWSIETSTSRRFGDYVRTEFGTVYESVNITDIPLNAAPEIQAEAGKSGRRNLFLNIKRDSRSNPFLPHDGSVFELMAEYYGGFLGGDDNFYKIRSSWSRYQIVWPGWISATRIGGGWAEEFDGSTDIPIDDRFNLGGANTVRSFREKYLGPLSENGTPLGSKYYVLFNQEFRWRTIQILNKIPLLSSIFESMPLWQSVFFDAGNGFLEPSDFSMKKLALVYGTGIQIISPAGPIRLDYARRIRTEYFTDDYRWHFTILYAF